MSQFFAQSLAKHGLLPPVHTRKPKRCGLMLRVMPSVLMKQFAACARDPLTFASRRTVLGALVAAFAQQKRPLSPKTLYQKAVASHAKAVRAVGR